MGGLDEDPVFILCDLLVALGLMIGFLEVLGFEDLGISNAGKITSGRTV